MARYIDADALIESFRKCYSGHLGMENSDSMMTFKSICRIINEQPTAYNLEKIVAELEEKKNESLKLWKQYQLKDDFGKMFAFDEAIKTVKKRCL